MEAKGAINQYEVYQPGRLAMRGGEPPRRGLSVFPPKFTINLAAGTTPFVATFDGIEYSSNCYRLTVTPVVVSHVWYRPARDEFEELHPATQDHVLNGGLLLAPLGTKTGIATDPVRSDWTFDKFQAWCLEHYGRRLPADTTSGVSR